MPTKKSNVTLKGTFLLLGGPLKNSQILMKSFINESEQQLHLRFWRQQEPLST